MTVKEEGNEKLTNLQMDRSNNHKYQVLRRLAIKTKLNIDEIEDETI